MRHRRHVAAVRPGNRLQLWLDGQLTAESATFDSAQFNRNCDQLLHIGSGVTNAWRGGLWDVRASQRAFALAEIATLARTYLAASFTQIS